MYKAAFTRTQFHRHGFMRYGLEVFTRDRFSQKIKVVLHLVLNSPFWIEQCKFRAKKAAVFKSTRFRCLHVRQNRIVLKTLHFRQRFQIDPVSPMVSVGVV